MIQLSVIYGVEVMIEHSEMFKKYQKLYSQKYKTSDKLQSYLAHDFLFLLHEDVLHTAVFLYTATLEDEGLLRPL